MNDSTFFDTTIIVYAYDRSSAAKHETCKRLIADVADGKRSGTVSNQVLAELFSVLTTKMKKKVDISAAEQAVADFAASKKWEKVNYSTETVRRAVLTSGVCRAPFWDTLIAETMLENGITTIITEDASFSKIPGIKVVNPFEQKSWHGAFKGLSPMTKEDELGGKMPD